MHQHNDEIDENVRPEGWRPPTRRPWSTNEYRNNQGIWRELGIQLERHRRNWRLRPRVLVQPRRNSQRSIQSESGGDSSQPSAHSSSQRSQGPMSAGALQHSERSQRAVRQSIQPAERINARSAYIGTGTGIGGNNNPIHNVRSASVAEQSRESNRANSTRRQPLLSNLGLDLSVNQIEQRVEAATQAAIAAVLPEIVPPPFARSTRGANALSEQNMMGRNDARSIENARKVLAKQLAEQAMMEIADEDARQARNVRMRRKRWQPGSQSSQSQSSDELDIFQINEDNWNQRQYNPQNIPTNPIRRKEMKAARVALGFSQGDGDVAVLRNNSSIPPFWKKVFARNRPFIRPSSSPPNNFEIDRMGINDAPAKDVFYQPAKHIYGVNKRRTREEVAPTRNVRQRFNREIGRKRPNIEFRNYDETNKRPPFGLGLLSDHGYLNARMYRDIELEREKKRKRDEEQIDEWNRQNARHEEMLQRDDDFQDVLNDIANLEEDEDEEHYDIPEDDNVAENIERMFAEHEREMNLEMEPVLTESQLNIWDGLLRQ